MNISNQKHLLSMPLILGLGLSFSTMATTNYTIRCKVSGSLDYFLVDASKHIYASEQFTYYQLIDGLTVLVLNNKTLKFNRITNLNLLANSTLDPNDSPEQRQFFSGRCQKP